MMPIVRSDSRFEQGGRWYGCSGLTRRTIGDTDDSMEMAFGGYFDEHDGFGAGDNVFVS